METDVEIANFALAKLGERSIAAFGDDSPHARLVNLTYADLRDALLREHAWNFAMARASIAANSTPPTWGFARAFELPAACLRVWSVYNPNEYPWKVEGSQIVSDIGTPIKILYINQITNPAQFDSLFVDTFSAFLAAEWAEKITGTAAVRQQMTELYMAKLTQARSSDGQEGTPEVLEANLWIQARI